VKRLGTILEKMCIQLSIYSPLPHPGALILLENLTARSTQSFPWLLHKIYRVVKIVNYTLRR